VDGKQIPLICHVISNRKSIRGHSRLRGGREPPSDVAGLPLCYFFIFF